MTLERHQALIYLSLDLVGGPEKARYILTKLKDVGEVINISSIYKRYLTPQRVDLNAYLEFVIRFQTLMSVDQTLHMILSFAETPSSRQTHCELTLLAYDQKILMSPRITLPYPHLHTDPLVIRCASEAWGNYEHPIYLKTLNEISKNAADVKEAEFYLQGKSLVDF